MMLNNKYDAVLIGKNYISYLLGLILQDQGQMVLLIDDPKVGYGENWSLHIGEVEKRFLKTWGEVYQLNPLINIENYLRVCPTILFFEKKIFQFGESPASSMRELMRKVPELFDYDPQFFLNSEQECKQFNDNFDLFCDRVSEISFKFRSTQNFDNSIFENANWDLFRKLRTKFVQNFKKGNIDEGSINLLHRALVSAGQSLFQSKLANAATDFELSYLLLSLLSPRYMIDHKKLNSDLKNLFIANGGHLKKTTVQDWQIEKGRPVNILLESFEGVIHPNEVFLMGGTESSFPFTFRSKWESCSCLDFKFKIDPAYTQFFAGKQLIYSERSRLGTDFPYWYGRFSEQGQVVIKMIFPQVKGGKSTFYQPKMVSLVRQDLKKIFPELDTDHLIRSIEVSQGTDQWIRLGNQGTILENGSKYFSLRERFAPDVGQKVSSVRYWGPLRAPTLGMFSFYMDLKNHTSANWV